MSRLTNALLWAVYLALLGVLLPHTAWAFRQFEPPGWNWLGWVAALAFEGAIAAFTWKLKESIEASPRLKSPWRRLRLRYLNAYSVGLATAIAISVAANWAHAVEFGQEFAVFTQYAAPRLIYSIAFGAILPFCSLLFARILANVQETEEVIDAELTAERERRREAERRARVAEEETVILATKLAQTEDIVRALFAESKRDRILAVVARWPRLAPSAVAVIAEASPSYVSEVLKCNARESEGDNQDAIH
jgi:hypothetical protein